MEGNFFIWIVGYLVSMTIVNAIMRKVLSVKKKELFSYNFVNAFHKKGEWVIRISSVIVYVAIFVNDAINPYLYIAILGSAISLAVFRAIIEKKYAENPKDYIYTLSELGFSLVIAIILLLIVFPKYFNLLI